MRLFIFVLAVFTTSLCMADTDTDSDRRFWLKSGHYAELDTDFSQLQADYEAGRKNEAELVQAYVNLTAPKPLLEKFLTQWLRQYPASHAGHVARGIYYYRMAIVSRGTDFIVDTPRENVEAMRGYLEKSRDDLEASVSLVARPFVSMLYLQYAAGVEGGAGEARAYYQRADRLDPRNWFAKARFMSDLRPRWGGSYAEMHAFLEECRQQGTLSAAQLNELESYIYLDQLDKHGERVPGGPTPQWMLQRLAELVPLEPRAASDDVVNAMARYFYRTKRFAEAATYLEEKVRRGDNAAWIYNQLTWILVKQKRMSEGWAYALRGADLGDASAEYVVGNTLYRGCRDINLPADKAEGIKWLQRAAAKNDPDAIAFLQRIGFKQEEPSVLQRFSEFVAMLWARLAQSMG